jgi:hypothetical protein
MSERAPSCPICLAPPGEPHLDPHVPPPDDPAFQRDKQAIVDSLLELQRLLWWRHEVEYGPLPRITGL